MLRVTAAPDAQALVARLAEVLAVPPADPFAIEQVVVHSRGNERWIAQRLSHHLGAPPGTEEGVCAGVAFPSPRALVEQVVAAVTGSEPTTARWRPEAMTWEALAAIEDAAGHPWAEPLLARIGTPASGRRVSGMTAAVTLLDSYARERPAMVTRWLQGDDIGPDGGAIDPAQQWQPALLRLLRRRIATPSPVESYAATISALRDGRVSADLPQRVSLFGFTALPAAWLAVLAALGGVRDVDVLLLHPSASLWRRSAEILEASDAPTGAGGMWPVMPRRDAPDAFGAEPRHPLLRSWGRDVRELQALLRAIAPQAATAVVSSNGERPTTLLHRLQDDLVADRPPGSTGRPTIPRGDRSLQVHAAPGPARQVQALRDAILGLMAADPSLQPRDIVVMCPDVEAFAPHVTAHLGVPADSGDADDAAPELRVRLADRSLRQVNPLFALLADLLRLATARVTTSQVLDLVSSPAVRRRFRLDEADLEQIDRWLRECQVRWGLDEAHRVALGVPAGHETTLQHGLERLLLGVALPQDPDDDTVVGGVAPYDHVEGTEVAAAGRLAELVARLGEVVRSLAAPRSVPEWMDTLLEAVDLLGESDRGETWQRTQVVQSLRAIADDAGGVTVAVALDDVRLLLADLLRGQPTRENHRSGDLTVCTLVPMRSVPHRVVCLLGMDDQVFPRRTNHAVDDLVGAAPVVGDRDPRTEDRQLLLDALMSATDALVVVYDGADVRSGAARPPCVPIAELLDVLDDTGRAELADGGDATLLSEQVHHHHPLSPYAPEVFLQPHVPAFDPVARQGAVALLAPRRREEVAPLPALTAEPSVAVRELHRALERPAATYLQRRLGVWLEEAPALPEDEIPTSLYGLDEWRVGDALLHRGIAGDPAATEAVVDRLRGEGRVPPLGIADKKLYDIAGLAADVLGEARRMLDIDAHPPRSIEVDVAVGSRRVSGMVDDVRDARRTLLTYSKLTAKHILPVWIDLVLLTAHDPSVPWTGALIGRDTQRRNYVNPPRIIGFPPLADDRDARREVALRHLAALLDVHDHTLSSPTVLTPACGMAFVEAEQDGRGDPAIVQAVREEWASGRFPGDDVDVGHTLLLGGVVDAAEMMQQCSDPGFAALARRLWEPICAHLTALPGSRR